MVLGVGGAGHCEGQRNGPEVFVATVAAMAPDLKNRAGLQPYHMYGLVLPACTELDKGNLSEFFGFFRIQGDQSGSLSSDYVGACMACGSMSVRRAALT